MICESLNIYLNVILTCLLIVSEILAFKENSSCWKSKDEEDKKRRVNGIIQGIIYSISNTNVKYLTVSAKISKTDDDENFKTIEDGRSNKITEDETV
jgi:hypothetical protein